MADSETIEIKDGKLISPKITQKLSTNEDSIGIEIVGAIDLKSDVYDEVRARLGPRAAFGLRRCPPRPVLMDIAVTERGFDPGGEFCRDFDMNPRQVAAFFHRAQAVSQAELHSGFDYLPCYVQGRAMFGDAPATWEIRTGGTARIIGPHAEARAYGYRGCENLLRPGP